MIISVIFAYEVNETEYIKERTFYLPNILLRVNMQTYDTCLTDF